MPVTTVGTVTIWMIALLVPSANPGVKKLAVYEFGSHQECMTNVPYLKRYYRLYGDRWNGKCTKTTKKRQVAKSKKPVKTAQQSKDYKDTPDWDVSVKKTLRPQDIPERNVSTRLVKDHKDTPDWKW